MLIDQWEQAGCKIAALAEAVPEEQYESRAAGGVRTFGETLRHLAFWNQYAAASARGEQPDGSANELPAEQYRTKAQILEAFSASVAETTAALRASHGGLDAKTAEVAVAFLVHSAEHYGQLAVYSRLAGIVPPASR
jgi:uncharacterized damage-inducible protein DinB